MKLLYVITDLGGGGAERVLQTLANRFVDKGYDVAIACNASVHPAYQFDERIKFYDLYKNFSQTKGHVRKYLLLKNNVRRIAKEYRPDIVISFQIGVNVYTVPALWGLHIPVICTEHLDVSRNEGRLEWLRFFTYFFADAVTVLTRRDRKFWHYRRNVVRMPNPIVVNDYESSATREKIILAAGSIDRWYQKGFDSLLEIWSRLSAKYCDWRLVIAGGGSEKSFDYLRDLVKKGNISNSVEFLGFRSDLYSLMQRASIFVLPSRYEGFGMVLAEAMSLGCCCVSYDCKNGPSEIIKNYKTGILATDQDKDDFTSKLERVITDDQLRSRLQDNAVDVIQTFGLDNIVYRWEILFHKILRVKK